MTSREVRLQICTKNYIYDIDDDDVFIELPGTQ